MSRYFEGYYCKDDNSVEGISSESSRKVLQAIAYSYPEGITQQEISDSTGTSYHTVTDALKILRNSGYIKKEKGNKLSRGRPKTSADTHLESRAFKYYIENRNFALNEKEAYQFAAGYTKYNPDFLYAWNVLVEKDQLDEIYPLLIKLLRRVMTKITGSSNPILKEMVPMSETNRGVETMSMLCRYCRTSHEARDFIRAILLHLLDEFEATRAFVDFFSEHKFISKGSYEYQHLLNQAPDKQKFKKTEQAREWLDNLDQDAKETVVLILKENSSISLEQLKSRVDKLTDEQCVVEQLGEYTKMSELEALSIIADEQKVTEGFRGEIAEQAEQAEQGKPGTVTEETINKVVKVNQILTSEGIFVTLRKVEFAKDYTAAFLTVENRNNDGTELSWCTLSSDPLAIQGKRQFAVTLHGPRFRQIKQTIPSGIEERGVIKFEPLDPTREKVKFRFRTEF